MVNPIVQGNSSVKVPFRCYYSQGTSGTSALQLTEVSMTVAALGNRVIDLGDVFTEFRIDSLYIYSFVASLSSTASMDNGVIHGFAVTGTNPASYVTPTTIAQLVDFPVFAMGNAFEKVKAKISKAVLWNATPTVWYNTSTAAADFSAGTITIFVEQQNAASIYAYNQQVIVTGVVELRGPIDPALVPLDDKIAKLKKELNTLEEQKVEKDFTSIPTSRVLAHTEMKIEEKKK